jgi:hypothetical protein
VEQRVLTNTVIQRGTVRPGGVTTITAAASPDAQVQEITHIGTGVGSSVDSGRVLVEISGRPLIALPGMLPAYRDLKPSDTGRDVVQLQQALTTLRLLSDPPSGTFDWQTKQAVAALYQQAGYPVPSTGGADSRTEQLALRAAQDAVSSAQTALKTYRARQPRNSDEHELTRLVDAVAKAGEDQQHLIATTGPVLPRAEAAFVPRLPAQVIVLNASLGGPVRAPLATLSTGQLEVSGRVDVADKGLLRTGMRVDITAEALGDRITGALTSIETAGNEERSADDAAEAPKVPVTIRPAKPLPLTWNGQDVRLTFTTASTPHPVLVVPVTAVSSDAAGHSYVEKLSGASRARVTVTTGLVADGYCEVSANGEPLRAGDSVIVGQQR